MSDDPNGIYLGGTRDKLHARIRELEAENKALEAERDKMREALEAIVNTGEGWLNRKRTRAVANAALAETEGE